MSLAQSILEFLATDLKAMTLFATHYHELTLLSDRLPQIMNAHMSVVEKNGQIDFLHTLLMGPAQKSYGIQVAKLAGIPATITDRARELLVTLESKNSARTMVAVEATVASSVESVSKITSVPPESLLSSTLESSVTESQRGFHKATPALSELQGSLFDSVDPSFEHRNKKIQQLIKQLNKFSINESTPLGALIQISKWQKEMNRLDFE
jgi:DNA mismatch repair ATPase MutS